MLEVDLVRDAHLDLLDQHLLKLLRPARRQLDEIVMAAGFKPKLKGLVDEELAERWLDSAQQRYLVDWDGHRWGLTPEGARRAAPLSRRARNVGAPAAGVSSAIVKVAGAAGLVKAGGAMALGWPGLMLALNARRYAASRGVVELVADKDRIIRQLPEDVLEMITRSARERR